MEEMNKVGIFREKKGKKVFYFTKSVYPGFRGFDERVEKINGEEYREIKPERSKFMAAIAKGLSQTGIRNGSVVRNYWA